MNLSELLTKNKYPAEVCVIVVPGGYFSHWSMPNVYIITGIAHATVMRTGPAKKIIKEIGSGAELLTIKISK